MARRKSLFRESLFGLSTPYHLRAWSNNMITATTPYAYHLKHASLVSVLLGSYSRGVSSTRLRRLIFQGALSSQPILQRQTRTSFLRRRTRLNYTHRRRLRERACRRVVDCRTQHALRSAPFLQAPFLSRLVCL